MPDLGAAPMETDDQPPGETGEAALIEQPQFARDQAFHTPYR